MYFNALSMTWSRPLELRSMVRQGQVGLPLI